MTFRLEELRLKETYTFDVNVSDGETDFAGTLFLSPTQCLLTVMGEETSDRRCNIKFREADELRCWDLNKIFILKQLTPSQGKSRTVTGYPEHISFFQTTFHVGYTLFVPADHVSEEQFDSISVYSDSINRWVGNTYTQEEIVRSNESIIDRSENLTEFVQELDANALLGISYNLSMYHSSPSFESGITFPPSLDMVFRNGVTLSELLKRYWRLYNLFSFLVGRDFVPDKVKVGYPRFVGAQSCSLYFCTEHLRARQDRDIVFFPLTRNLRFDRNGLPPFPLEAFTNYFCLSESDQAIWRKYCFYKRLANTEDRFLGFFRLLEKLCFKKACFLDEDRLKQLASRAKPYMVKKFGDRKNVDSFVKGILRYNKSKYNAAKCIQDFYAILPHEETSRWHFSERSIERTCKIRNDISHANDIVVDDREVAQHESFVHILLVLAMCSKMGVNVERVVKAIPRLDGYWQIVRVEA